MLEFKEIVQSMSNAELDLKIALSVGHIEISEHEDVKRRQRDDYNVKGIVALYGDHYIIRVDGLSNTWAPSTDPASALIAETWALLRDDRYIDNLVDIICPPYKAYTRAWVAELFYATPRQRAEAAWITLQIA